LEADDWFRVRRSRIGFLVVIERGATSFGAYVPDLPSCLAVGSTMLTRPGIEREIDVAPRRGGAD